MKLFLILAPFGAFATLVLHHSMVRLPEKPMMPRLFVPFASTKNPSSSKRFRCCSCQRTVES